MTLISENKPAVAAENGIWNTVIVAAWNRYLRHRTTRELIRLAESDTHRLRDIGVTAEEVLAGQRLPSARDAATELEITSLRR